MPRRAPRFVPPPPQPVGVPTVASIVREQAGVSWSRAKALCTDGRVTVDGERCLDPAARVGPGAVVKVDPYGPKVDTGPLPKSAIVHADQDVVVVDKPAGMLSVADEADNRDTLAHHTRTLLRKMGGRGIDAPLGVVHRLDRDTSGLMMFTRNASAHRELAARFRDHDIERVYHALAHGAVPEIRMETYLILDRGDGLRGSHGHFRRAHEEPGPEARIAVTFIKPVEALANSTLVECRLETGRQHQIRIHLAELGHPVIGEFVYIRDYRSVPIEAPRTMLHARALGFVHPRTGRDMFFESEPPADFAARLRSLRR
jgi:23S rRNA pseudouridine1911/1915/1917 synthase